MTKTKKQQITEMQKEIERLQIKLYRKGLTEKENFKFGILQGKLNGYKLAMKSHLKFVEKVCSYMEQFSKDLEEGIIEERQSIIDFQEVMNEFVKEEIAEIKSVLKSQEIILL